MEVADPDEEEPKDLQECRTLEGMRFERVGIGQYRVFSQEKPGVQYDVDLRNYGALGSCTCPDQTARRHIRWRSARRNFSCFRCKHIRQMRDMEMDAILLHGIKDQPQ